MLPSYLLTLLLCAPLLLSSCAAPREDWRDKPISYQKEGLWNKPHLTWRLNTLTPIPSYLVEEDLIHALDLSFKSWEPGRVFTFSPAHHGPADIVVSFDRPISKPWDGKMGTMGVAAFPWTPRRGHIHLDPSEWWSTRTFSWFADCITDWLPHEIGHVLGLRHQLQPGHTMSRYGPYGPPDEAAFTQLRYIYAPDTRIPMMGACCAHDTTRDPQHIH
jgi:hypothetical protein